MTSLIINAFAKRDESAARQIAPLPPASSAGIDAMARSCTFCNIIDGKLPAFKVRGARAFISANHGTLKPADSAC